MLYFKVYEHLNLMERDYFGLTYKDSHEHMVGNTNTQTSIWSHSFITQMKDRNDLIKCINLSLYCFVESTYDLLYQ